MLSADQSGLDAQQHPELTALLIFLFPGQENSNPTTCVVEITQ